ncbi:unnamed protein product [Kluyveromyces dobzhanskii CBS 2104]|uniref:WGS project CCBQ000000000 data, contig MAT n=1 Tax=Kluyveromyces dobzhanskii CBS 2104 TaxID=1427455 RepID=A0A0A8L3L5_9SACH|nr:unnamed protein product [Kluyveromyces dobzhanskii CBS 2104]
MAIGRYSALLFMVPRIFALPIFKRSVFSVLQKDEPVEDEGTFTTFLIISVVLVLLGGIFAGLTLGLMGQDEVYLKVMQTSGSATEKYHANRVLNLLNRGKHWVLVTLLLSNVITNETLPIVLDRCLGGGWQAVVMSTVLIVIFGEIIPQSICVRFGLQVGSLFSPFVLFLMYAMYPISYPIALLLDWLLGEDHGTIYKKSGLKTLVHLHRTMGLERLTLDEVTIISAVLDLKEKKVCKIMTPIDAVFTLSADKILDEKTVEDIFNSGFSRIPIYLPGQPTNFIGMLLVRVLISYDPEDCLPVSHFPLATLPETAPQTSCLNILNYFQEGKSHMCVVSRDPGSSSGAMGLVTLEDVIEELIGEEIVDESDVFVDIHQRIMRDQPGPLSKRHITSYLHSLYNRKPSESQPLISDNAENSERTSKTDTTNYPTVVAKNFQPANPAANPLDVKKPFVTIKRQSYGGMARTPPRNSPEVMSPVTSAPETVTSAAKDTQLEISPVFSAPVIKDTSAYVNFHDHRHHADTKKLLNSARMQQPRASTSRTNDKLITTIPPQSDKDTQTVISSSCKSTRNGIVESIITVKGVSKTIIEPASDWDDSQKVIINETGNIEEAHTEASSLDLNFTKQSNQTPVSSSSRRGSRFSLWSSKSSQNDQDPSSVRLTKSQESFNLEARPQD